MPLGHLRSPGVSNGFLPITFLDEINGFKINLVSFADDSQIGITGPRRKITEIQKTSETVLEIMSTWFQQHGMRINLRPDGGCSNTPPPLQFFADSKKTAARSAAGFSPTLSPIFLATFVKVSILGHARSGHQVRSSDHTLKNFTITPQLQCSRECYETFGI